MRTTKKSKFFSVLLGMVALGLNLSSCADDEDMQQEELEQGEEVAEYSDEFGEEVVDDSAAIETGEPSELGDPVAEDPMAIGLAAGEDSAMPEPVENSLEQVADDQTAQLDGGDSYGSESFQYTIVKGDWLSKIAQRVYGDMYKWPLIANANTQIKNPNLIYPNDVISVPIIDEQSREFSRSYASVDQPEMGTRFVSVKVEKGETLCKIAKKVFGKAGAWKTIWQANQTNIPNPDMLSVGQVVKVPVSKDAQFETVKVAQL